MFCRVSLIFFTLLLVSCTGSESVDIVLDIDGDGVIDSLDAFPQNSAEAYDTDNDSIGNNADTDDDNDGTPDISDDFPLDDSETLDTDGDGVGNNSDDDDDGDGVADTDDDLPLDPSETVDTDNDGIGNNADTDDDNDGVNDFDSNGDVLDLFPLDPLKTVDTDSDGIINEEDPDDDNDGVLDNNDAFPLDASETLDTDNDGIGNNTDLDDDGDGTLDVNDGLPLTPNALPTLSVTTSAVLNEKSNYLITATGGDADGPITYSWIQVSGVTLDIQQQDSATVSITTPAVTQDESVVFSVTVTDTDSLTITKNISATITANTPPLITINFPTLTGIVGETFSFDASLTTDVDNDTLGYLWNLDTFPGVSGNLLSNTNTDSTILSTDVYGTYQLSLNVTDGIEISSQQITVDVVPSRFGAARYGNHAWSKTQ